MMFDQIDDIVDALNKYMTAKAEHDEAMKEYDGYSWDYFGATYQEAINEAGKYLKTELDKYIDDRIQEVLKET